MNRSTPIALLLAASFSISVSDVQAQSHGARVPADFYQGTPTAMENKQRNARQGPVRFDDHFNRPQAELERRGRLAQRARGRGVGPQVRFNEAPRRSGSGYNNTRYDRRVAQPRSVLKGGDVYREQQQAARLQRRLSSGTRARLAHGGQHAQMHRQRPQMTRALRRAAPGRAVQSSSRTLARSATSRHATRAGRSLLTPKNLARGAAGGAAAAAVGYGVYAVTGVEIPNSFDTSMKIIKDPLNAPRHINQFGKDSINATGQVFGKVVGSKKAGRDLSRGMHSAAKSVSKEACKVGALFGAKC